MYLLSYLQWINIPYKYHAGGHFKLKLFLELVLRLIILACFFSGGLYILMKARQSQSRKKQFIKKPIIVIGLLVVLSTFTVIGSVDAFKDIRIFTSGTTEQIPVKLVRTIDGDTIKIIYQGDEINVRYLLIDTPETNHPRLGKQPFGEEASERNDQLVKSGKLTIDFDVGERLDKYGRLLAYVYVDGKSVQEMLLEEGLARVAYVYPPNTRYLTPFEKAEKRAKQKGLGIWSIENYTTESGFDGAIEVDSEQKQGVESTESAPKEYFKNCTELRKVYPDGVPEGHPAYQPKLDRDNDGYACE